MPNLGIVASSHATASAAKVLTLLTNKQDLTESETTTTASFTPTANSKLYVYCYCQKHASSAAVNMSLANSAGLTSTLKLQTAGLGGSLEARIALWEMTVGSSPVSMTVTPRIGAVGTSYGSFMVGVFDATNTTGIKLNQLVGKDETDAGGATQTHTTATLPSAVLTGNTAVLCLGVRDVDGGAQASLPSGWTRMLGTTVLYLTGSIFHRTGFTGTSVTISPSLGAWVFASASLLFELE